MALHGLGDEWKFPLQVVDRIPKLYADTFSGWSETLLGRLPSWFRASLFDYQVWQLLGLLALLLMAVLLSRLIKWLATTAS